MEARNTVVVDVRTRAEYSGGHVVGSVNIPLQEIQQRLEEIKQMEHVILCCASGGRSGQATQFLQQHGVNCENGGSWMDVNSQF
ncbi:MAG: rhodanese-like domain-containing protein [Bacteroidetes bacterium]|jgi:rhodanese-related sulfurtransferase|nr:rhodanese-like domain-containing protein [Bacteroidota bacterium]